MYQSRLPVVGAASSGLSSTASAAAIHDSSVLGPSGIFADGDELRPSGCRKPLPVPRARRRTTRPRLRRSAQSHACRSSRFRSLLVARLSHVVHHRFAPAHSPNFVATTESRRVCMSRQHADRRQQRTARSCRTRNKISRQAEDRDHHDDRRLHQLGPRRPRNLVHFGFDRDQKVGEARHVHQPKTQPPTGRTARRRRSRSASIASMPANVNCASSDQHAQGDRPPPSRQTVACRVTVPWLRLYSSALNKSRRHGASGDFALLWPYASSLLHDLDRIPCRPNTLDTDNDSDLEPTSHPLSHRFSDHSTGEASQQGRRESNPQPPVLETGALPIELHPCASNPTARMHAFRRHDDARRPQSPFSVASVAFSDSPNYSRIFVTTPEPTVLPPSRMAKRTFSSMAIGLDQLDA